MKRVHVWLKGLFYLGLLPWLMIRLSALGPHVAATPHMADHSPGSAHCHSRRLCCFARYLVLAALGKEWPFGPRFI